MSEPAPRWSLSRLGLQRWIVSGLGIGYMPVASGTWGSAVAAALALAVWGGFQLTSASPALLDVAWIVLTLIASACCVIWGPWAVEYYAARSRKQGDPGVVVIDEFAGQWIALVALPFDTLRSTLIILAVQFLLFRFFDVGKFPPARQLERLPHGWGILLDDLAAGAYANICGQILFRLIFPGV